MRNVPYVACCRVKQGAKKQKGWGTMHTTENLVVDCDAAIRASLEEVGQAFDVNRVGLYAFEAGELTIRAVAVMEWTRKRGLAGTPSSDGSGPEEMTAGLYDKLSKNLPVMGTIPVQGSKKSESYSHIILPVMTAMPWGFLRCEHNLDYAWSAEDLALLLEMAHRIGAAIARKQQIQTLQRDHEHFQVLIENISDIVVRVDEHGVLLNLSGYVPRMDAYALDEILGHSIFEFVADEDHEQLRQAMGLFRKGRMTAEYRIKRKSGEIRWARINSHPIMEGGVYKGIWCIITDIDDIKRAEEKARSSEALYKLLEENINDVIWTTDMQLNFSYISPSNDRGEGPTIQELMAQPFTDFADVNLRRQIMEILNEELARENSGEASDPHRHRIFVTEWTRKNGEKAYVEMNVAFMRDPSGTPIGIIGVSRDVIERVHMENALRATEARQRYLLENIRDILLCYDDRALITYVSENIRELAGYEPREMIGRSCAEFIHSDFLEQMSRNLSQLQQGKGGISEYRIRHKEGSYHWYRLNCKPHLNENGGLAEVISVLADIDAYKVTEQEFRATEKNKDLYQHIVDQVPDLVWAADLEFMTMYMSPSVQAILGYTVEEALSIEFGKTYRPESLNRLIDALREASAAARTGKCAWSTELAVHQFKRNRRTLKGLLKLSVLCDQTGKPYGYLGITTFRKRGTNHRHKESSIRRA